MLVGGQIDDDSSGLCGICATYTCTPVIFGLHTQLNECHDTFLPAREYESLRVLNTSTPYLTIMCGISPYSAKQHALPALADYIDPRSGKMRFKIKLDPTKDYILDNLCGRGDHGGQSASVLA